jgi:hypothetical protein
MPARSRRRPWCQAAWAIPAGRVSDSGSETGAASSRQVRSGTVVHAELTLLTCTDARKQALRTAACLVRDEVLCNRRRWSRGPG